MSESLVLESTPADGVRVLAFNRPTKRNALSQDLIREFLDKLSVASVDANIKTIVITGSSSFFCAGADIKEISVLDAEAARQTRYLENLCQGLQNVRKPMIAAVEGMALGGGFEVALACDMIYASNTSKFGLPEVSIGLLPGAGGTQRLTNAVGKYKAMHMILLGSPSSAQEARAAGLVADTFEAGTVLDNVMHVAARLTSMSPTALSLAKEAICRSDNLGRDDEFERSLYYHAFGTADKREGVGAFLEKRAPSWAR
ncbi:ClpP/crotonase-like domain-containing protein [Emericellopsis atlantica]|uniref:ClpP/crotonase-like domain-containing protein n=1 Tax=Emericellopsis atlantica TaxID=2614577 RepID=A0A9P7ZG42_9HYPO|nr:ClpP/crotonase-like domain-containing protein [Emericellopsis atlantica]KAG9251350.1 ClpP/crotonase-like domain-containing protein [Emericellopsis atlantica]